MKIAIIADDFALGTPAQQLRDRLRVGYTRDGIFQLATHQIIEDAAQGDAILVVQPNDKSHMSEVLNQAPSKTPVFNYGLLGRTRGDAQKAIDLAKERNIPLCAGSVGAVLVQLPQLHLPENHRVTDALAVAPPGSELIALDGLISILDSHGAKFDGNWRVRVIDEETVWQRRGERWSNELLEAALSRSDKILGKTLEDGRTENVVPQIAALAKNPRMALYEVDGLRAGILIAEELLGDVVIGLETKPRLGRGRIHSTQLFQAPSPQQEHFSRLAAVIDDYFRTSRPPWSATRSYVTAVIAEQLPKFGPGVLPKA